jgi:hypothetical protein
MMKKFYTKKKVLFLKGKAPKREMVLRNNLPWKI